MDLRSKTSEKQTEENKIQYSKRITYASRYPAIFQLFVTQRAIFRVATGVGQHCYFLHVHIPSQLSIFSLH